LRGDAGQRAILRFRRKVERQIAAVIMVGGVDQQIELAVAVEVTGPGEVR